MLQTAAGCEVDYGREVGSPEDWNVPAFMIVDLSTKILSTTAANESKPVAPTEPTT